MQLDSLENNGMLFQWIEKAPSLKQLFCRHGRNKLWILNKYFALHGSSFNTISLIFRWSYILQNSFGGVVQKILKRDFRASLLKYDSFWTTRSLGSNDLVIVGPKICPWFCAGLLHVWVLFLWEIVVKQEGQSVFWCFLGWAWKESKILWNKIDFQTCIKSELWRGTVLVKILLACMKNVPIMCHQKSYWVKTLSENKLPDQKWQCFLLPTFGCISNTYNKSTNFFPWPHKFYREIVLVFFF